MAHLQSAKYGDLPGLSLRYATINDLRSFVDKTLSFSQISWDPIRPSEPKTPRVGQSKHLVEIKSSLALANTITHTAVIEYAVWEKRQALCTYAKVTVMSAFRKDLFVSVTLPLVLAVVGAFAIIWGAYTHIDSKLDAAKSEASSGLDHLSDTLRQELRADREARAKEFETLRVEMREDRKDARDAIRELNNRS